MEEQKDLPKPELDLPLPEKEIPAHSGLASQGQALRSYKGKNVWKSKFFLGFVALSVLVAFLVGGFALGKNSTSKQSPAPTNTQSQTASPTPNPTADWKTYSNKVLSFKYPSNYLIENTDGAIFIGKSKPDLAQFISFDAKDLIDTKTLEKCSIFYEKFEKDEAPAGDCLGDGKSKYEEVNSIKIDNVTGENFYVVHNPVGYGGRTIQFKNPAVQIFNMALPDELFSQLLSTFKFTNFTTDTSNWKTYNGQIYSLKYPNDWTTIENQDALTIYPSGYPFTAPGEPAPNSPYLKLSIVKAVGRGVEPIKQVNITIDGQETVKYYESETVGIIKAITTPDNRLLSITFQVPQVSSSTINSRYDQILSTFKFTK